MSENYDVVVVGAGIMGCCAAFELAKRGVRVAVLEKDALGGGSTGRSSAIIRQHYSNELTAQMALYSLRVFQEFDDRVGGSCDFHPTGFVALVGAEDRCGLERNIAMQRRVGIRTQLVAGEDLRELVPGMETADLAAAAYEPESGYADPHLTVTAYAEAARRYGARIHFDHEVTGFRFVGDEIAGVDTTTGHFAAPRVINCAGPWGARVAAYAGVDVPVNACRIQVAVFRRPDEYAGPHPVVLDFIHATYFRSETGQLTLVGLIDPAEADAVVDPDDYPEHLEPEFVSRVGEPWLRRYPAMESSRSTGGYAGLYAVTPDWHPVIDEVPQGSGHFLCTGFSGHGFKLAPAVGVMMAEAVLGGSPLFPSTMFRLDRYATKNLVVGQYEYSITG